MSQHIIIIIFFIRLAQQQQNEQGILYCYDLMANLAYDTYDLNKAEKLFVSVLQILLGNGTPQNDLKVSIIISMQKISTYLQTFLGDSYKPEIGQDMPVESKHGTS